MPEEERRDRRRRGSLSRGAVVEAALALVDEEGLEALSMPRLARRLDVGAMTIYGYVANKADLVEALAERVLAGVSVPDAHPEDWAGCLAGHMRSLRAAVLAHPALGAVLAARGLATPTVFANLEASLEILRAGGFPPEEALRIYYALLAYTLGFLAWEIPRTRRQPPAAYAAQWAEALAALPADEYPRLHEVAGMVATVAGTDQFEAGLGALLRGFAGGSRRPPAARSSPPG